MGADVDEVEGSEQSRGHHEAAAKGGAGMAQGAPREQHVAQRQQHGKRDDDDHKEGADCCAIKQPPPASPVTSQHNTQTVGQAATGGDRALTGNYLRAPLKEGHSK